MIGDGEYFVLEQDNVEQTVVLTGKTETEIRTWLEDGIKFGKERVFWREGNHWYSFDVAWDYLRAGVLDEIVKHVVGNHAKRVSI